MPGKRIFNKVLFILFVIILGYVGFHYLRSTPPQSSSQPSIQKPTSSAESVASKVISPPYIPSHAATAIARFGQPVYSEGFLHFNHVNPNAPKGGTLRLSTVGTFDTVNKDIVKGIHAIGILLCYDALMTRSPGEPFTLYALLAQAVDLAPDASSITFYINPKARFHDGSTVTAEDVKATIETLRDKGLPRYRQHYSRIDKIAITHPLVIKIYFKPLENGEYDPELPFIIASLRVLKKTQIEAINFADSGLTKIIGSGPYQISRIDQGRSITLQRNPDYWGKDLPVKKGENNFDTIRIEYFKNAQAQFQAFTAGEYDVHFEVNPNQWQTGYNFTALKDGRVKRVEVNHQRPVAVRTIIYNMRRPIFADRRVRKALALAYDFDTLNKMVYFNSIQCPHSLFANTYLAHQGKAEGKEAEILKSYANKMEPDFLKTILENPFTPARTKGDGDQRENLAQADILLKQAGWVLKDGKRLDSKGQPLKLELMIKDPRLEKVALSFKESLKKLGIELVVRMIDTVQYENRVIESDFDMIIHTWSNSLAPGNEQVYYFSSKTADIKGSSNYIGIKDVIAEGLAQQVAIAHDKETLVAAVHALDRYVMQQYYQIPIAYENTLRWAYWVNRLAIPELDPQVGLDVMNLGWSPAAGH
jgi:microcin C transport system substrate-binding protein